MQIKRLKQLDKVLGRFLAGVLPAPRLKGPCLSRRILFIRPGGIGDAIHLIPSLLLMKEHSPACVIDVLAEKRNSGALGLCPEISRVFLYDRPSDMIALFRNRYDVIIDTEQWYRLSAVVARFVRSDWKIGFATNERRRLFNHVVEYSQRDYEITSFYRLLEPLGVSASQEIPPRFLSVPDTAKREVKRLLLNYSYDKFVIMTPFATIRERLWPATCFREVAQWCLDQGYGVIVVGGAGDRRVSEELLEGLEVYNLTGRLSLAETAAVMEHSSLVLSVDSGPLHIAVGLGCPTVSLFGSGIKNKWAPREEKHVVLSKDLPCSPCTLFGMTPPCPIDVQCMQQITAQEVVLAMDRLLKTL